MASLKQRIVKGGAVVLSAHVMQKGFTAIFVIVFSQLLSLRMFGELMLAMTLMNLLTLVSLFGLPAALQKFCSGEKNAEIKRNFRAIASLITLSSGLASIVVWLSHETLAAFFESSPSFASLMAFAAAGIFAQGIYRLAYETLRAREDGKNYFISDNLLSVGKIAFPLVCYFTFSSAAAALGGLVLAYAVAALWTLRKVSHSVEVPELRRVAQREWAPLLRFSLPAWLAGFTYVVAQHVDKIMLGALLSASSVGLYTAASTVAMLLTLFHTAFAAIFSPVAADSQRTGKEEEMHQGYRWVSKWSLFTCGAGLLVFAGGGDYILSIFGSEYANPAAYAALLCLCFFYFACSSMGPSGSVLQMCGSNEWESFNAGVFLVVNIAANLTLIPKMGILGAALATLLAGFARLALQWWQLRTRHNLRPLSAASTVMALIVVVSALAAAFAPPFSLLRIGAAATGLVALTIGQFLRLSDQERHLATSLRQRKFNLKDLLENSLIQST